MTQQEKKMHFDCENCGNHHNWPGERCPDCGRPFPARAALTDLQEAERILQRLAVLWQPAFVIGDKIELVEEFEAYVNRVCPGLLDLIQTLNEKRIAQVRASLTEKDLKWPRI
jgi:ribosomal protein L37E